VSLKNPKKGIIILSNEYIEMVKKSRSRRSRKAPHICKHCKQSKHRNHSFKKYSHKKHKHCKHPRRTRRRGGSHAYTGAPLCYNLSGDWSSRMSTGQGADYFKYHQGQHGGNAPIDTIGKSLISDDMVGSALQNGPLTALNDVRGLTDQGGGRRRRRTRRRGGGCGALGFAPFPSEGMLLDNPRAYAQAGLNPEWKTAVEFTDAQVRETQ